MTERRLISSKKGNRSFLHRPPRTGGGESCLKAADLMAEEVRRLRRSSESQTAPTGGSNP